MAKKTTKKTTKKTAKKTKKKDDGRLEGETLVEKIIRTSAKAKDPHVHYPMNRADPGIKKYKAGIEIWEQQPAESERDYSLFQLFLHAPHDKRTVKYVAEETGRSYTAISTKSSLKKWRERRDAYLKQMSNDIKAVARERLEQGVKSIIDEFSELNKLTLKALKNPENLDIEGIDNPTSRIYAFEKLLTARDKALTNALKLIDDGKKINGASIEGSDNGIVIRFVKSTDAEDE